MIENTENDNISAHSGGTEFVRLQKYIAQCGLMSRRAAEKEIIDGNVTVNGKTAELGVKIDPLRDKIKINGLILSGRDICEEKIYIMLNKPVGYVTTMKDELGRKCVSELVSSVGTRIYPVGRLDCASEGLLIMTNDGELANRLTHPKHNIPKIYEVKVRGSVSAAELEVLTSPLVIDGYRIIPVNVKVHDSGAETTTLIFELYEGRNRQIRKMCDAAGLKITRLKRVAVGEIKLGGLKKGSFRNLTKTEIEYLCNKS